MFLPKSHSTIGFLGFLCFFLLVLPAFSQEASLLNPLAPSKTHFEFHIDAVDPSPDTNPKGAAAPGYRGVNQVVVYTPAFGTYTQTNGAGVEAVVTRGRIAQLNSGNTEIPIDGFVVSGHGQGGQWIQRVLKVGASAAYQSETGVLLVDITPQVYIVELTGLLEKARVTTNLLDENYTRSLAQGEQCVAQISSDWQSEAQLSDAFLTQVQACKAALTNAIDYSVRPFTNQFKGAWVCPTEKSPGQIKQAVSALKALNIEHLFLQTYYLGQPVYPSQVAVSYGLPKQHVQFEGWDPLKTWVDEAHAQGLKVHAWVQVFYAGNKNVSLEPYGPILTVHPEWRNVQRSAMNRGVPVPSTEEPGHYFVDPANPEAQTYLKKIIREIATQYSVDGVNLDYIRYPASLHPSRGGFLESTWGYTPASRERFAKDMWQLMIAADQKRVAEAKKLGKKAALKSWTSAQKTAWLKQRDPWLLTPKSPLWQDWVNWRKAQVTQFVTDVSTQIKQDRPGVTLSSVVFLWHDPNGEFKLQDWPQWVQKGLIDALTPIGLTSTPEGIYADSLKFKQITQGKVPVYPGIFAMYNREAPEELMQELRSLQQADMPGVMLFERGNITPLYQTSLKKSAFTVPSP